VNEVDRKIEIERNKCITKYGEAGLLPGGDPARDVFDYAANELIGLMRYSEMMRHRLLAFESETGRHVRGAITLTTLHRDARAYAESVLAIRREMLDMGATLGAPEGNVTEDTVIQAVALPERPV
jgi:hypothetical protein